MTERHNHLVSSQPQHRHVQSQNYTSPVRVQQVNTVNSLQTTGLQRSVTLTGQDPCYTQQTIQVPVQTVQSVIGYQQQPTTTQVSYVQQSPQYSYVQEKVVQSPQVIVQERVQSPQQVIVQERVQQSPPQVVVQERVVQSPPQVVVQEKIVEKPVYYEKEVEKIVDRPYEVIKYVDVEKKVEVPVYFENEDRISQLSQEIHMLKVKLQQEIDNHAGTQRSYEEIYAKYEIEINNHGETKKRANKKPKEVTKEVYIDVIKEVPVEKVVTEYIDREVVKTVENVDEINRLKGDVDFWRRKAEEWESKWVQLSNEEVEYQVVQTRSRGTVGGSYIGNTTTVKDADKIEGIMRQSMSPKVIRQSIAPNKVITTTNNELKHSGHHHRDSGSNIRTSGYTYTNSHRHEDDTYVTKSPSRTVYYD